MRRYLFNNSEVLYPISILHIVYPTYANLLDKIAFIDIFCKLSNLVLDVKSVRAKQKHLSLDKCLVLTDLNLVTTVIFRLIESHICPVEQ